MLLQLSDAFCQDVVPAHGPGGGGGAQQRSDGPLRANHDYEHSVNQREGEEVQREGALQDESRDDAVLDIRAPFLTVGIPADTGEAGDDNEPVEGQVRIIFM